jgi:5'-methylthioadenosine phosphorylase
MTNKNSAEIAIIGGTGIYDPELFNNYKEIKIFTPYGSTSDLISLGEFAGKKIAFLQRHGRGHVIPPHKINFRANIWALKELGVKQIIASSAVGSLRDDYKPGEFVLTDQFIDRTKGRLDTFYEGGQICHISAADPICPSLRHFFADYAEKNNYPIHTNGTYVCIEGPRFSTRAESKLFRDWGCDIIGMTLYPEVILAREVEICYVTVSMVTDYDVWADKPVSAVEVLEIMQKNALNFKKLIMGAIPNLPKCDECSCQQALTNALA